MEEINKLPFVILALMVGGIILAFAFVIGFCYYDEMV